MSNTTFASLEDFAEHAFRAGWTDGLPVLPPEPDVVDAALATVVDDPAAVLWTSDGKEVAVADVAVAAVLAGCKATYFPVVLAAAEAYFGSLGDDGIDVSTLPDASQCVIVNGPVRTKIEVNCGFGLYGPGWRANATIGRALRFVVRSTLGTRQPAFGDPGQYTLCFGEDEERSGWTPLHVQRGFSADTSAVTVHSTIVRSMHADRHSTTPEGLLDRLVVFARGKVSGAGWFGDDPCSLVLVIPEETRRVLGKWSKDAMHDYLFERLVAGDDTPIHPVRLASPNDLLIVAAGGPAFAAIQLLLSHRLSPVTTMVREC